MKEKSITAAVTATVALMLTTGVASWLNGDVSGVIIFQKILIAPMFLLACKGLRAHFPERLDERRSLARQAQFEFLNGALLAAFITCVVFKTDGNFWRVVLGFCTTSVGYGSLQILMSWNRRRMRQRAG